jgi:mannan endo-1,4-beta-mannosidase
VPPIPFPRLPPLPSGFNSQRPHGVRLIVLLLLAVLGCALLPTAVGAATEHGRATKAHHRVKPRPLYWGAWIGDQLTGTNAPWDMNAVAAFEQIVGKGMSLVEFSSSFEDCSRRPCRFYKFPNQPMDNIRAHGSIPVFSWGAESTPRASAEQPEFQLSDVIEGTYDSYVAQFASEARDWGHPFFLRFNWEMNGDWFPWSEKANGNAPGQYIAAWRHVHDIFTAVGATNATWVWCPFVAGGGKRQGQPLKQLYPGTAYVDWACMDGYNWGPNSVNPQKWRSFSELFTPTYEALTKRIAPDKPLMLGEFASTPYGGHKALWIKRTFQQLPGKYPRIRALIYFDSVDRGVDWPLETSPSAAAAFAQGIHKGIYANNRFGELVTSPILPLR